MNSDDLIKEVKLQKMMGASNYFSPRCNRCGTKVFIYNPTQQEVETGESRNYDRYCHFCLAQVIESAKLHFKPTPKKKRVCNHCYKPKKLVGAWCRSCRNKQQKRLVLGVIEKLKNGKDLNVEDEQTLGMALYRPIWKRKLNKFMQLIKK